MFSLSTPATCSPGGVVGAEVDGVACLLQPVGRPFEPDSFHHVRHVNICRVPATNLVVGVCGGTICSGIGVCTDLAIESTI